jgi:DtxR family transcriptional regulator, Mn-dependent transcriptional regulator
MPEIDRPSSTVEDYLGVIYTLTRDGERVIAARLVESLDVSASTVNANLKRMQRDGWVQMSADKEITLTDQGLQMAASVIRRHMLTEWMLSRVLKLPLSELHREAHQIEHTLSSEVEERLQSEMADPQVCPHGNPLPGHENAVSQWLPLSEVSIGRGVVIRRIHENLEDQYETLAFLETKGLMPGTQCVIRERLPFNETIHVLVDQSEVVLGLKLAAKIYVAVLSTTLTSEPEIQ